MLHNNLDILLISETKVDSSFPTAQFQVEDYTTYRLDRNANAGGILLYVRENIPSLLVNSEMSIESFYIEINIGKKKYLLVYTIVTRNGKIVWKHGLNWPSTRLC